jgi:hypothetical protein
MTWPGYTGVLQVMAPGRFSAALNQAPMRYATGLFYIDWAANRRRVWHMPYPTPAHLLRKVAEEARNFDDAHRMLVELPISTPAIFTLAGTVPHETAVIERTEREARAYRGSQTAANHWQTFGWTGHSRGEKSADRARILNNAELAFDPVFPWLKPPVLNDNTRLVMVADAKEGRMLAQGFENTRPATAVLDITWLPAA